MDTVIISPAFEIRIPKRAREALGLAPGQRLRVVQYAGRIELAPFQPAFECPGLFGEVQDGLGAGATGATSAAGATGRAARAIRRS